MTLKTHEEKREFLQNLYNKHADVITEFRQNLVTELDPEAVEREGKFENNDSCCGNGCGHCDGEGDRNITDESMQKAIELTFQNSPDFPAQ